MRSRLMLIWNITILSLAFGLSAGVPDSRASSDNTSSDVVPLLSQTAGPVHPPAWQNIPLLTAEGSNSCEIVSCGMGLKDTCKITCPAEKTPKCSCDCAKSFGPMCTEYKANCKCE